uniref:guanine nucleotide-binding protein-like 1 n=1 Tax=Pristiophorus japonicus TaxID=55135 RepID=UPI00398F2882
MLSWWSIRRILPWRCAHRWTNCTRMASSPWVVWILAGIYPIAQIQEPYTSVGYLAARIPVQKLLKLKPPDVEEDRPGEQAETRFTAWDICEAWAEKRGYKTTKAARNEVYRMANSILPLTDCGRGPLTGYRTRT